MTPAERVVAVAPSGDHAALFPSRREAAFADLLTHLDPAEAELPAVVVSGHRDDVDTRVTSLADAATAPGTVLLATIGGLTALDLVPELDFEELARSGAVLCGYSDVTVLQLAGLGRGLTSLVGPMLMTQFGDRDGCDPFTWASFRSALDFVRGRVGTHVVEAPGYRLSPHNAWGSPTEGIRSATPCAGPRVVTPGVATGRVVCANVASLDVLVGTPFEPDLTGVILALDVAEEQTTHDIRRLLLRLRLLDRLRHVEAIVFGRLTENGRVTVDDLVRTVTPFCGDLPLVLDLPLGHVDPIATLPQGAVATLEAADGGVRLVYGS